MAKLKFPSVAAVASELRGINALEAGDPEFGCDEPSIDVRLQVYPDGTWNTHFGDSQYDQDHRGFWGASSVPGDGKRFNARAVAVDLIEQARDHWGQS